MLKYVLLGLLAASPRHGYQLKQAIEEHFHGAWPVNTGQVYTTLDRLERDGLVEREVVPQDLAPDRRVCSVTAAGRLELKTWLLEPVDGPVRLKDELFAKALVHRITGDRRGLDAVWKQREAHLQNMAALTRLLRPDLDPTTRLLLDGAILRLQADLEWLDRWERLEEEHDR